MARNPTLGLLFSRFSPMYAITRFSSMMGTMSAAILTATRSSMHSSSAVAMPLLIENACMSL